MGRPLGEVPHQQVAPRAGVPLGADGLGAEPVGEPVVQRPQRRGVVEHHPVAGGVGAPAGDDVAAVGPAPTDRVGVGLAVGQRLADGLAQFAGVVGGEFDPFAVDCQFDAVAGRRDGYLITREERDQEREDSLSYPQTAGPTV